MTSGLKLFGIGFAISLLSACGTFSGMGESIATPSLEQMVSAAEPSAAAPPVEGTYRGSFTEKCSGKTYSGTFYMVVHQHDFKIRGRFEVEGGTPHRSSTSLHGTVSASATGAKLRFVVPWLGGYDIAVDVRASVAGNDLTGTGHGSFASQRNYERWTFKATKN